MPPFSPLMTPSISEEHLDAAITATVSTLTTPTKYCLQPTGSTRKRSRCQQSQGVHFCPVIRVTEIPNKESFTREEKISSWYDPAELCEVQRDALLSGTCHRGLESQTLGAVRTRTARLRSTLIVIKGQRLVQQKQNQAKALSAMQRVYQKVTAQSRKEALERAKQDEHDAQEYQNELESQSAQASLVSGNCWFFDPSAWFPRTVQSPFEDLPSYA